MARHLSRANAPLQAYLAVRANCPFSHHPLDPLARAENIMTLGKGKLGTVEIDLMTALGASPAGSRGGGEGVACGPRARVLPGALGAPCSPRETPRASRDW